MQNLTEVSSYDANIIVPEEGEEITAAASGAGRGPIRVSLQSLANRAKYLKDRIAAVLDGTAIPDGMRILQLPPEYSGLQVITPELIERATADGNPIWVCPTPRDGHATTATKSAAASAR